MGEYILKREDIAPLLKGLTIYGTGGGGDPVWGKVILENEFAQGRTCRLIAPEDVPDDAFVCSGGIMGSVKALGDISYDSIVAEWEEDFPLVNAIRTMERLCQKKIDFLVPFEAGGLNTPVIMAAAARLNIPMIDGDGNGRSAPETQMTSFVGHGINLYPMPLSDRYGNITIVLKANETTYADEVGRFLVVKGGNLGANAHYPMTGQQARESCIPHTISDALTLGRLLDDCQKNSLDACEKVGQHFKGTELFRGTVCRIEGIDKGGFYLTNLDLCGSGNWSEHSAKLVIKNETMVLWVDHELKIMFPDRLFMLYPVTGEGVESVSLCEGMEIILIGAPCHPRIASFIGTEIGQISFGGTRYGYGELKYQAFQQPEQSSLEVAR